VKTAVASDEPGEPFFARAVEAFRHAASGEPEPEPEPELPEDQQDGESYRDYRERMNVRNVGDIFGASYGDNSGLPDWRNPVHIPGKRADLDEYAAQRDSLGIPDTTDLHGFSRAEPRSNPSPWRIV
jgi:hypothetical protein